MTPIGQPCTREPITWMYFVFVQSVFVFMGYGSTLATVRARRDREVLNAVLPWALAHNHMLRVFAQVAVHDIIKVGLHQKSHSVHC